jgi:hypothetical protein
VTTAARRAPDHPGAGFWITTRITPDTLPQVGRLAAALARDRRAGSRAELFASTVRGAAAGLLASGGATVVALWEEPHEIVCRVVRGISGVVGGPGSVRAVRLDALDAVLVVHGGDDDVIVRLAVRPTGPG